MRFFSLYCLLAPVGRRLGFRVSGVRHFSSRENFYFLAVLFVIIDLSYPMSIGV